MHVWTEALNKKLHHKNIEEVASGIDEGLSDGAVIILFFFFLVVVFVEIHHIISNGPKDGIEEFQSVDEAKSYQETPSKPLDLKGLKR